MTSATKPWVLWTVVLGLPMVFLLDLQVSYSLLEQACRGGRSWPMYVSSALAMALILLGGWIGWIAWGSAAERDGTTRLMALTGIAFSALFTLGVLSLVVPKILQSPCA